MVKKKIKVKVSKRPSLDVAKIILGEYSLAVEVGVEKGYNALSIYHTLNPRLLFLVDTWEKESDFKRTREIMTGLPGVFLFRSSSAKVSKSFRDYSLDFVYLDADHEYAGIKADLHYWFPKIRTGGILAGHDFHETCPGVTNAVISYCRNHFLDFYTAEQDWWIIKLQSLRPMAREFQKIHQNKPFTAIEVGVERGENAQSMLHHLNIKHLYLIDIWENYIRADKREFTGIDNYNRVKMEFNRNPHVTLVKKSSIEAAKAVINKSIDFIYIDADHSYKSVLQDIKAWYPKLKKGGLIGGHDYDNENCDVAKAVRKYFKGKHTVKGVDWWIYK